jgi:hypothetical protein
MSIYTPNSSRFINHYHSRFIQKFPFLVEMFYWALNYGFYTATKFLVAMLFSTDGLWEVAEAHGISILHAEHSAWTKLFFPLTEVGVQQFFMKGHEHMLTFLNRIYSFVHIPGTVFFISWYYFSTPNHATARHRPPHNDAMQLHRLLRVQCVAVHASATAAREFRLPRHRPP